MRVQVDTKERVIRLDGRVTFNELLELRDLLESDGGGEYCIEGGEDGVEYTPYPSYPDIRYCDSSDNTRLQETIITTYGPLPLYDNWYEKI